MLHSIRSPNLSTLGKDITPHFEGVRACKSWANPAHVLRSGDVFSAESSDTEGTPKT